jgi:hypothetical protein
MRTRHPKAMAIAIVAAGLMLAGCSSAGSGSSVASVAPAPSAVPSPSEAASPSASPESMVIEDAGVETSLPAGTYSSRLFKPSLTLELGEGWYRRDPNGDKALNLRRTQDLGEDVTFISGIDFIQCGKGDPSAAPDVTKIVAGITGSSMLKVSAPVEVPFGDHTGTAIKLEGGGAPIPEADFMSSNEFGCILSQGEAFPAESLWLMATRDVVMHLVVADVDGTTVIVRTRPGDTTSDLDALYDQTLKLLADSKIG